MKKTTNKTLLTYAIVYLLVLYLPVLLLPLFSFSNNIFIAFPITEWSFVWYEEMFKDKRLHDALWNSIRVATVTSIVSTILGLLAAKAITRYYFRGKAAVTSSIMVPLVIPEIVLATALLILVNKSGIGVGLHAVTAGHILWAIPFSVLVLMSRLDGFDKNLEEAAMDLGENAWGTFKRVTFPLVLPGIVSSLLLAFVISFDEFVLAFFLTGTEVTLPVAMYSRLRFPLQLPPVLAMASFIIIISFVVVIVAELFRRKGQKTEKIDLF